MNIHFGDAIVKIPNSSGVNYLGPKLVMAGILRTPQDEYVIHTDQSDTYSYLKTTSTGSQINHVLKSYYPVKDYGEFKVFAEV